VKRWKEYDSYLTHVCGDRWIKENPVKRWNIELSVNTVTFISCRCRLTKLLAGVTRGKEGSKGEAVRIYRVISLRCQKSIML